MRISIGSHFMGSYHLRTLLELKSTRKISTSYFVARLAITTPTTNNASPPKRMQEREDGALKNQSDEEQTSLCSQDSQWAVPRIKEPQSRERKIKGATIFFMPTWSQNVTHNQHEQRRMAQEACCRLVKNW
jgi:hypothetical protein